MFVVTAPFGSLKLTSFNLVADCSTMVLSETRGLQLSSVIRGGIGWEWRLGTSLRLTFPWILALEPSVSRRTRLATAKEGSPKWMERTLGPKRSSCLWLQLFGVEMCSFLPDG